MKWDNIRKFCELKKKRSYLFPNLMGCERFLVMLSVMARVWVAGSLVFWVILPSLVSLLILCVAFLCFSWSYFDYPSNVWSGPAHWLVFVRDSLLWKRSRESCVASSKKEACRGLVWGTPMNGPLGWIGWGKVHSYMFPLIVWFIKKWKWRKCWMIHMQMRMKWQIQKIWLMVHLMIRG